MSVESCRGFDGRRVIFATFSKRQVFERPLIEVGMRSETRENVAQTPVLITASQTVEIAAAKTPEFRIAKHLFVLRDSSGAQFWIA